MCETPAWEFSESQMLVTRGIFGRKYHPAFPLLSWYPLRQLLWVTVEGRIPDQTFNVTTERCSDVLLLFCCGPDELRHTGRAA